MYILYPRHYPGAVTYICHTTIFFFVYMLRVVTLKSDNEFTIMLYSQTLHNSILHSSLSRLTAEGIGKLSNIAKSISESNSLFSSAFFPLNEQSRYCL